MTERLDKKWEPRDAEGKIYYDAAFEDIDFTTGEWMVLARTNKMLEPLMEHFYNLNLRFDSKIQKLLPSDMLNAYRVWQRLNQDARVSKDDVKDLWQYLSHRAARSERL
jgi:hypothetical protein